MKILIIGTQKSGAQLLMNGISEQGYEYLENPFKIKKIRKQLVQYYK